MIIHLYTGSPTNEILHYLIHVELQNCGSFRIALVWGSVGWASLDFGLGHDLRVLGSSYASAPHSALLQALLVPLPLPQPLPLLMRARTHTQSL